MKQEPINEARLFDELAELLLQMSNRCALLAQSRKSQKSPMTNDQLPIKIIKDNHLFILRNGKIYNAQGAEVK